MQVATIRTFPLICILFFTISTYTWTIGSWLLWYLGRKSWVTFVELIPEDVVCCSFKVTRSFMFSLLLQPVFITMVSVYFRNISRTSGIVAKVFCHRFAMRSILYTSKFQKNKKTENSFVLFWGDFLLIWAFSAFSFSIMALFFFLLYFAHVSQSSVFECSKAFIFCTVISNDRGSIKSTKTNKKADDRWFFNTIRRHRYFHAPTGKNPTFLIRSRKIHMLSNVMLMILVSYFIELLLWQTEWSVFCSKFQILIK